MKRPLRTLACILAIGAPAAAAAGIAHAQSASSPSALLQRMSAAQAGLKSYTASVHADIALHTFPYISPSLDGTYYHKEPSKNKIVFTGGLPFIAKEFSKVYPEVESPSRWEQVYEVSSEGDNGSVTTLKLVPRKHGRIDHIDARVDDKSAEVISLRWNYSDGGFATLDQSYSDVDGHSLVTGQTGHFEVPHWNADLKSTFSGFKLNADIPDSVFDGNG